LLQALRADGRLVIYANGSVVCDPPGGLSSSSLSSPF
jgi:hypothetical protein